MYSIRSWAVRKQLGEHVGVALTLREGWCYQHAQPLSAAGSVRHPRTDLTFRHNADFLVDRNAFRE